MINITIDGISTTREQREIQKEFIDSKEYDFCKSGMTTDERGVIKEWLKNKKYSFLKDDEIRLIEYIACKL
jgi:hypothetical protein